MRQFHFNPKLIQCLLMETLHEDTGIKADDHKIIAVVCLGSLMTEETYHSNREVVVDDVQRRGVSNVL